MVKFSHQRATPSFNEEVSRMEIYKIQEIELRRIFGLVWHIPQYYN